MNKPLHKLLAEAVKALPPQGPGSRFQPFLPVLVMLHTNGHSPESCARFLADQGEISTLEIETAGRSIRNLLAKHSPLA